MGMLSHGVYIAVTMSNATFLDIYCDLPNEQESALSAKSDLFQGVQSIEELAERIPSGFAEDTAELLDDRFDGFLDDLQEQSLNLITAVILIADRDEGRGRCYEWRRCLMHPYSEDSGVKIAVPKPNSRGITPRVEDFAEAELFPALSCEQPAAEPEELTAEQAAAELEEFKKTFGFSIRKKDEMSLGTLHPKGIVIKRYKGKDANVVIPEYVGGHKVSEIEYFGSNRWVEQVECAADVLINDFAFENCKLMRHEDAEGNVIVRGTLMKVGVLKPVTVLPDGIDSVCCRLLPYSRENRVLQELVIPEGVKKIGLSAFERCWGLKKLVLPSTLELIEPYAFRACSALEEVCFPEGLKEIGNYAFADCYKLLPKGIGAHVKCGKGSFAGCSPSLAREDGITCFGGTMYDLHLKKHKEYLGLPEEEWSVVIPADIKRIAGSIIFNNPGNTLDRLTIHNGLEYMDSGDFFLQGIRKLRLVDLESGELLMETEAFASCDTVLASTSSFEKLCEMIEQGKWEAIVKKYGGKNPQKSK